MPTGWYKHIESYWSYAWSSCGDSLSCCITKFPHTAVQIKTKIWKKKYICIYIYIHTHMLCSVVYYTGKIPAKRKNFSHIHKLCQVCNRIKSYIGRSRKKTRTEMAEYKSKAAFKNLWHLMAANVHVRTVVSEQGNDQFYLCVILLV